MHPLVVTGLLIVALTISLALALRMRRSPHPAGTFFTSTMLFAGTLGMLLVVLGAWDHTRHPPEPSNSPVVSPPPNDRRQALHDSCTITIHIPPMMNNASIFINGGPLPVMERLHDAIIVKAARGTGTQKLVVVGTYRQCITFVALTGDMDIEACL